ncbi:acetyl-CoA carboxylase biotin carboxyl carrier protein subunit [Acetobacter sacchari]|uniref:Biotin carboxyl carrier protein of acetyl-CoA carboxylase n=1 Tax=Acetobacter sacchari TaxID=2661687 RepID=A0ABS3LS99_9PROT|nr:biotin/lipoyl-containing protein [Acetobacter sacchari]MBO1358783.1 acetyl-CoA carboxylase biotin carboxyl carrier protein subunit [Acetobacter sacchari]
MTIDLNRAEALMERMQKLGVAELEVRHAAERYRIVRQAVASGVASVAPQTGHISSPVSTKTSAGGPSTRIVSSSMHGVFYRAAGPGQPPFVDVGAAVQEGQTLYILEVMKTLSRVGAEFPCKIVEIIAEDGQAVEPGDPLFAVETVDA